MTAWTWLEAGLLGGTGLKGSTEVLPRQGVMLGHMVEVRLQRGLSLEGVRTGPSLGAGRGQVGGDLIPGQ